jgi:protein-tyrosine phosphatase
MQKILFVCLGNICRSPTAHGISEFLIEKHGLESEVSVDSAGTGNYQIGKPADARMRSAAIQRGYGLNSIAKQLTPAMVWESDWVIAMDRENYRDILQISRGEHRRLHLLGDFLGDGWPRDVPDPYYGGQDGFAYVLDMLEAACPLLLERVLGRSLVT